MTVLAQLTETQGWFLVAELGILAGLALLRSLLR